MSTPRHDRSPVTAVRLAALAVPAGLIATVCLAGSAVIARSGVPQAGGQAPAQGYMGVANCTSCHPDQAKAYRASAHARTWDERTPAADRGCETCHGPGQWHTEDVGAKGRLRNFNAIAPRDVTDTCMRCHNREEHALFQGSMHDARNVGCTGCHSMHTYASERAHLRKATVTDTCATCHRDKAAKLRRSGHMPVREGKLECTTCHNQHGSVNARLLRTGSSVVEFCVSCHAEKRGPFLWEHAPVRENCATCHDPHGSSTDRLLVAKVPMLCQRCHIATRHPSSVYDSATLLAGSNRQVNRSCVNCHSTIHGSNHPAGARFQR